MPYLPSTIRKIIVNKLSTNFREATSIINTHMPKLSANQILVKLRYVGINASDVNFTSGRYFNDGNTSVPFDAGFEGMGEVVAVGSGAHKYSVGQNVMFLTLGAFTEYCVVNAGTALAIPSLNPEFLSVIISGLTAAISLDKLAEMKKGDTVLVTAAAGGTGQFAVQIAKQAGCQVIGTCSSDQKVDFLRNIGCDRPINYVREDLNSVLKKEYPEGVDVVYECVGGETFNTAIKNLASHGRLLLIGYVSGYQTESGSSKLNSDLLVSKLITSSSSVRGFFLRQYASYTREYAKRLFSDMATGRLKTFVDCGINNASGQFCGLEAIADAVEYIYAKKNMGKVVVELNPPQKQTSSPQSSL